MRGGYKIIDLKGLDIKTSQKIDGIYESIEATRKPTLISNLVIDGKEFAPFYSQLRVDGSEYIVSGIFAVPGEDETTYYAVVIDSDDMVTAQEQ